MGQLLTSWLTIGTAGPTIDGREISEQDLLDAAASYDPKNYCAVVNVDHSYGNLGTVEALRTAKDDQGRLCLQAQIRPNDYYLAYNYADMKLFFSMELTPNFAGTGKKYLSGLAATDDPASLGTTCARFSKNGQTEKFMGKPVAAAAFAPVPDKDTKNQTMMQSFKTVLQEIFSNNHKGDTDMTEEQFKALQTGNQAIQDAFGKLLPAIEKLTAGSGKPVTETPAGSNTPDPAKTDAKPGETDFAKQFNESLTTIGAQLKAVADKLDEALDGKKGTEFGKGTGSADEEKFV